MSTPPHGDPFGQPPRYDEPGYERPGYEGQGYERPGYEGQGYERPGYEAPGYQAPGYEGQGYGGYAHPAPGYGGYAYPAPGHDGAPPPAYGYNYGYGYGYDPAAAQRWGYDQAPAFGHSGPGFAPGGIPGQSKPGIIPLRPLTLSDIFNGAVGYIRSNPKATLGLTAMVVVVMQLIALLARLWPLTTAEKVETDPSYRISAADAGAWMLSGGVGLLITWLGGILLSGLLTVVVGRAVFGAPITIREAWARVRGRLPALMGLALLETIGIVAIVGLVAVLVVIAGLVANAAGVVVALLLLVPAVLVLLVYLYTELQFAPILIVLERLPVIDAVTRSFSLVRNGFWRVLGIVTLATLAVSLVNGAVSAPFTVFGAVLAFDSSTTMTLVGSTLTALGGAIGQIVTAPFSAGVAVLLYTDRRMRSEAFDLVLQTGAANGPAATQSTDNLWLTRTY